MTRAVVLRVFGDPTIGAALADGIQASRPLTPDVIQTVSEDIKARKLSEALEGVKKPREAREWREKLDKANAAYRPLVGPVRAFDKIEDGWAMIWYLIDKAYRKLSAINREP